MTPEKLHIGRTTLKRFRNVLRMLLKSDQGKRAMMFIITLFSLMIAINGLNVVNSYVGRDFMSAIENKELRSFWIQAGLYAAVFLGSTVVAVFYRFTEERLGILWREQLTRKLTEEYMKNRTYYRLDSSAGIANPDQRISEDVRAFTTTTLSFTLLIVNGTLTAISFSGVLWSISPQLFLVAVSYATCGSLITIYLGKPLIRLNYNQLDMEANFRADLIHVRENSESIALAHREGRFSARLNRRLDAVTSNFRRLIRINRNLGFFTTAYNLFIQIIPALIIAPLFIRGELEFGVITQSTMAFATLLGSFSLIVTQFQSISAFTAVTARLHSLSDAIERNTGSVNCSIISGLSQGRVVYENVTLHSADGMRVLIDNLNLEIPKGARWAVVSKEDAPKVVLFRATAGVWECGGGTIMRPGLEDILFLPERPYLPPGTLREVLLRTGAEHSTSDADILSVLRMLSLDEVLQRIGGLDTEQDWDDLLSIGEQHQLSVARLFLAKPKFVFLDRPGSALSKTQIAGILDILRAQGVGVVVLAKNGESRLQYDAVLEIRSDGSWEVRNEIPREVDSALENLNC